MIYIELRVIYSEVHEGAAECAMCKREGSEILVHKIKLKSVDALKTLKQKILIESDSMNRRNIEIEKYIL